MRASLNGIGVVGKCAEANAAGASPQEISRSATLVIIDCHRQTPVAQSDGGAMAK